MILPKSFQQFITLIIVNLILCAVPPIFTSPILAAQNCSYYVSTEGNNTNSGRSQVQAFRTIAAGVNALNNSTGNNILCIASGNYSEQVQIDKSGSTNTPLIIRGENPNAKPVIDGKVGQNGPGSGLPQGADRLCDNLPPYTCHSDRGLIEIRGNNITVENLEVINSRGRGIAAGHPDKPTITNITIQNNIIHDVYHSLITLDKVDNSKIHRNLTYRGGLFAPHPRQPTDVNWGAAYALRQSNNIQITENVLHSAWNDGIIFDGQDFNSSYITVTDNYIYDIWRYMIYGHGTHHSTIERNFLFNTDNNQYKNSNGDTLPGIAVTDTEANFNNHIRSVDVTVANNIVIRRERNIAVGSSTDIRVIQNTLVDSYGTDKASLTIIDDPQNVSLINNLIYQPRPQSVLFAGSTAGVIFSHNYWNRQPIARAISATDVIDSNPGLVNPTISLTIPTSLKTWSEQRTYLHNLALNFGLKTNSSPHNQGTTTAYRGDFFSTSPVRPESPNSQFDIGADEAGNNTCITCPTAPTPNIPNWKAYLTQWFSSSTSSDNDGLFNIFDWLDSFNN